MNSESSIRVLAILGIVIGLAGAGAGGTAIYFHFKGLEQGQDAASSVDKRLGDIEKRFSGIPPELSRMGNELRGQIQSQVQGVAQAQAGAINSVHAEIGQLRDELTALTNKPAPPVEPVAPPAPSPEPVAATPAGPGGTYVIQSGDTFGKIAKNHGTTSAAIQSANPDVDPARLKIGQKINLP